MSQGLRFPAVTAGTIISGQSGYMDGFVVKFDYIDDTRVIITDGNIEANGKKYTLIYNTPYIMHSLTVAANLHYVYIDDDASSPPTPTFIDSTTEPSWDAVKRGWYNGDDRCIGFIYSPAGIATIYQYDITSFGGKHLRIEYPGFRNSAGAPWNSPFELAALMNPDSSWQTPNIVESDILLPIFATEAYIFLSNSDAGHVNISWLNKESADANPTNFYASPNFETSANYHSSATWGPLGASRKIRMACADDDDNNFGALLCGCGFTL